MPKLVAREGVGGARRRAKRLRGSRRRVVAPAFAIGALTLWSVGVGSARASPVATLSAGGAATSVSAGGGHTCAILAGGIAECWGRNYSGQLGNGSTAAFSPTPVAVSGLTDAVAISAGWEHSCAILAGGAVKCWGNNSFGQLGNGTITSSPKPVSVSGLRNVTAISAGAEDTCAIVAGGAVKCWGDDQLGGGPAAFSPTPVAVSGLTDAVAISTGWEHSCAILVSGIAKCWGYNFDGELGNGTEMSSSIPVTVSGPSEVISISAGTDEDSEISVYGHTCAILPAGLADCWGWNAFGQLGNGTDTSSPTPVSVSGLSNAISISSGGGHTCAVLADGAVKCWGEQVGNAAGGSSSIPVVVSGLSSVAAISSGGGHTCAVLTSGAVKCWGENREGQLGNGTTTASSTPVTVKDLGRLAPPRFGRSATVQPVAGTVLIRLPGANKFVPVRSGVTVPLRTTIDTGKGAVRLTAARGPGARSATETGLFNGGAFRVTQKTARSRLHGGSIVGFTVLKLAGQPPSSCAHPGTGSHSARRMAVRRHAGGGGRLWGNAHGNFQTGGRYATVTVRGTKWLTEDSCAGTRVKVARGVVSVDDLPHHRTVLVMAPHSYLARPGAGR